MRYIIEYKVKWETNSTQIVYKTKDEVLLFVAQIQRWIASIDWVILVIDMEWFDFFKVTEQNYDQINSEWKYLSLDIDKDWDVDPTDVLDPYTKNITKEVFNERLVSSKKKWDIYLHKHTMSVLWEEFPLLRNTKTRQVFEILIAAKIKYNKKDISYEEMEDIFSSGLFNELKENDFKPKKIRDTLKSKLEEFKEEFWVDVLKITKQGVKINV